MFIGLLFSRSVKGTHADQVYYNVFILSLSKERTHKLSKEAAAKNIFSTVYVIGTTCFNFFVGSNFQSKAGFSHTC